MKHIINGIKESTRKANIMVKEHSTILLGKYKKGIGRMGKNMVKVHSLHIVETSM